MSTPPARRRRDAVETTLAIERAATDLVLERGYDEVTVDMICEAAGISQRTFFNHFKTKDAALLGFDAPSVDQRAARQFVVSDGPLLLEAARLIRIEPHEIPADPMIIARRIRAIGANPVLLARQMERLSAIENEIREIILLRLKHQNPDEDETDLSQEAEIATHLLTGLMRYFGTNWARQAERGEAPGIDTADLGHAVTRALRKLV